MFYTYGQNNSGGSFVGPTYVIIEADTPAEADDIAESRTPIYFDGCEYGRDCDCCGDRWYRASDYDANATPKVYDVDMSSEDPQTIADDNPKSFKDSYSGYDTYIYYADGRVVKLRFTEEMYKSATEAVYAVTESRWGFRWSPSWDGPTKVYQVFKSDYGHWYAKNGNDMLEVNGDDELILDSNFMAPGGFIYNFVFKTEDETKARRAELVKSNSKIKREFNKILKGLDVDEVAFKVWSAKIKGK